MRKKRTSNALKGIASCMICAWSLCACGNVAEDSSDRKVMEESKAAEYEALFDEIEAITPYKSLSNTNPIMTQRFGADPYAMVYKDRVYFYMTGDTFEYDADGSVTENTYGKINTISVVSTTDMVNFEDHGTVYAAGSKGAAKWAANSWAPAAAWKEIDGEVKFFLYFANSGGGIGVLTSDSPTGPFEDPLGEALINNHTPNCADVIWIFDPAVLVDDDGRAYLYFGGGVPEGQAANPGTARVVELGEDMISIAGEPVIIDAPYVFEDSGIHKYNNKYYYTYCSNWDVDQAGTVEIKGEYDLVQTIRELSAQREEYRKVEDAIHAVRGCGYGVVIPGREEIQLEEPAVIHQGNKYGVKIKSVSPSIHMIKANIETEIAPIVGSEQQAEDLIAYIKESAKSPEGIWNTNIFGKSVEQLVDDGIRSKIAQITEDGQAKLQDSMQKIVNDSRGGMVCIII